MKNIGVGLSLMEVQWRNHNHYDINIIKFINSIFLSKKHIFLLCVL